MGFIVCFILGAVIGVVGCILNSLEQSGKAPWQKGKKHDTPRYYEEDDDIKDRTISRKTSESKHKKHSGKCDGDCANCPPHYGYRYGRWYYGHDHIEGCEFGGNKGSGSRD